MAKLDLGRIEQLQRIHGWSDRRTAKELGFSASYWCEIKAGKKPMTMDLADRMAEVFRLSYDRFLIHPSVKPDAHGPPCGLDHLHDRVRKDKLCLNPEHRMGPVMTRRDERQEERRMAALIPRQIRQQLWPRRWWQKKS